MTDIAEIKYELLVQLQYEQYYAEIEGKLPIFEQKIFCTNLKKSMAVFFQEFSKVTSNICYQHKMG